MQKFSLNLSNSILVFTGLYLLYRNLAFLQGDPFLLYIGIILILLFCFSKKSSILLILGIILSGVGIGQILIENQLTLGLESYLWEKLNTYWPVLLPLLIILEKQPFMITKIKELKQQKVKSEIVNDQ